MAENSINSLKSLQDEQLKRRERMLELLRQNPDIFKPLLLEQSVYMLRELNKSGKNGKGSK